MLRLRQVVPRKKHFKNQLELVLQRAELFLVEVGFNNDAFEIGGAQDVEKQALKYLHALFAQLVPCYLQDVQSSLHFSSCWRRICC